MSPKITLIAAVADNGVIGGGNAMPWRLSTDSRRFRSLTMGHPVIMGRKTWESLGKPLAGRHNIVITRSPSYDTPGGTVVSSLSEALSLARSEVGGSADVFVIGGGEIYREAMAAADRLYITHVHARPAGDTTFPAIDPAIWAEAEREEVPAGEKDDFPTTFVRYERRAAPGRR